jgi:hypothetical protein
VLNKPSLHSFPLSRLISLLRHSLLRHQSRTLDVFEHSALAKPLNLLKRLSLLALIASLTACAFNRVDPDDYIGKFRDRLNAEILGDGIKIFTYKARLAVPILDPIEERRVQDRPFGRSEDDYRDYMMAQRKAEDDRELWIEQVELGLEKTLAMSGFCRDGYHELNRFIDFDRAEIRGECKEGASQEDKEKYTRKAN